MAKLYPVILCGGTGTRLWPLSRRLRPKQFLPLVTDRTLLQDTILRIAQLPETEPPIVIGNHEHRFLVAEQLNELGIRPAVQILEPAGRNTAPALAVAALYVHRSDPDGLLLVLPSDHAIADVSAFREAVLAAGRIAERDLLTTFGIQPTEPHTGYGYVELGEPLPGERDSYRIRRFVEKPDAKTAQGYVDSGRFLWNSGMFMLPARLLLKELRTFRTEILAAAEKALDAAARDLDFLRLDAAAFEASPAESIDYAVMEKTSRGAVVRADIGWSDVGSWSALWDIGNKDQAENATRGDVHVQDASGCYIWSDSRLVFALGVKDLVIIETDDAVLVAERSRAQQVKDIVARLDREARSEHVSHTRVYRPWGYYESIDAGERFQVKRIMVKPGEALSLQMHRQRAEHWVVVSGLARVTRDDHVYDVRENESTFIPLGAKHRLENPTDKPLYLIEVQSGAYLGEDDIVRFDDRYNRR
ncbi:MAG TPA: mannose-1-phosphate guanylyltransferase/mannose-6-phosphate isomerase [Burkholderiales bacterium]|nr:mannose-1-phosphate guanylyltransferase/mannose-6-phosphate isomerase [Burkholderiales bacterium]